MDVLFQHTDYRAYLREWFEEKKRQSAFMSYRYLARRLDIDPAFLVHILRGKKHLSEDYLPSVVRELRLDNRQERYFRELWKFNRARSRRESRERLAALGELRDLEIAEVAQKQYRYYLRWHYPAVRLLLLVHEFRGDYAELGSRLDPPISEADAREAVRVLEELELVRWNEDGVLEPVDLFLTTGDRWKEGAVREFQDQTLELARRSLRYHSPEDREISTLTLAIPSSEMGALQELVRDFRRRVLQWTRSLPEADSVIQVGIAAFPLARAPRRAAS